MGKEERAQMSINKGAGGVTKSTHTQDTREATAALGT